MKVYMGYRDDAGNHIKVIDENETRELISKGLWGNTPSKFDWGNNTPGSRQAALAIACDINVDYAWMYTEFSQSFISFFPDEWLLHQGIIESMLLMCKRTLGHWLETGEEL